MTSRRPGLSTIAIHGRPHRGPDWAPAVSPIYQSATFRNPIGSDEEVLYTRYGNNPNQVELARKYALLEGAEQAIFLASGMAATALAHALPIYTCNPDDFSGIDGLDVVAVPMPTR